MNNFKNVLNEKIDEINNHLNTCLLYADCDFQRLTDAMKYSLNIGGKRIRPVLMVEFYRLCGGTEPYIYNFAAALEMIHTYSLIHDDLPCMDNDDFRRGKPSCHKAFDEATAVLAGDGLLTEAFVEALKANANPKTVIKALTVLAKNAGLEGMLGGQMIDIQNEGKALDNPLLLKLYKMKTGALICSAAEIGCILAGADDKIKFAVEYADNIGLAFQIVDDILDAVGDEKTLGKPIHSDDKNNKCTFVTLNGLEYSKNTVKNLTENAKRCIDKIGVNGDFLKNLADYLAYRDN